MNGNLNDWMRGIFPDSYRWLFDLCVEISARLSAEEIMLIAVAWKAQQVYAYLDANSVEMFSLFLILLSSNQVSHDDKSWLLTHYASHTGHFPETMLNNYRSEHWIHQFIVSVENGLNHCERTYVLDKQMRIQLGNNVVLGQMIPTAQQWLSDTKNLYREYQNANVDMGLVEKLFAEINEVCSVNILCLLMNAHLGNKVDFLKQTMELALADFSFDCGHIMMLVLLSLYMIGQVEIFNEKLDAWQKVIEDPADKCKLTLTVLKLHGMHDILGEEHVGYQTSIIPYGQYPFTSLNVSNLHALVRLCHSPERDGESKTVQDSFVKMCQKKLGSLCQDQVHFLFNSVRIYGEEMTDLFLKNNFDTCAEDAKIACHLGAMCHNCESQSFNSIVDLLKYVQEKYPNEFGEYGFSVVDPDMEDSSIDLNGKRELDFEVAVECNKVLQVFYDTLSDEYKTLTWLMASLLKKDGNLHTVLSRQEIKISKMLFVFVLAFLTVEQDAQRITIMDNRLRALFSKFDREFMMSMTKRVWLKGIKNRISVIAQVGYMNLLT
ncbi:hypothetical protein Ciccas_013689, partial [Cichlidogyrus casuarinus]